MRLPAAIAREARLHDNQTVELKVVGDGVLIRPVHSRLSLAERLAAYTPMEGEATEAMAPAPWVPDRVEVISCRRGTGCGNAAPSKAATITD